MFFDIPVIIWYGGGKRTAFVGCVWGAINKVACSCAVLKSAFPAPYSGVNRPLHQWQRKIKMNRLQLGKGDVVIGILPFLKYLN